MKGINLSIHTPSAFKPSCVLNALSKLYRGLIRNKLGAEKNKTQDFLVSNILLEKIVQAANLVKRETLASKDKWVVVITLDAINAFNSAVGY